MLDTIGFIVWKSMKLIRNEEVLVFRLINNWDRTWSALEENKRIQMSDIIRWYMTVYKIVAIRITKQSLQSLAEYIPIW